MVNYELEWLERNARDPLFSATPDHPVDLLDTKSKLKMLCNRKQLEQAISNNDLDWLERLDLKTTLMTVDQYCWNLCDDPWWHMFYGAIGLALFHKADLSVFELLLEKGAPTDRVYCREFHWYSAKRQLDNLESTRK